MTLDEIFRRILRGHLWVILVCIVVPLLGVVALQLRQTPVWEATVRIQVSTQDPSSTTEADALSGRVLALATTPSLIVDAMGNAGLSGVKGQAADIAKNDVTGQRLGESPVVDLTVSLPVRDAARKLDVALANRVIGFMNQAAHANADQAMATTTAQLERAIRQRDQISGQLSQAKGVLTRENLQGRLQAAQATVDQLSATKASMELAATDRDQVVIVDGDHPTVQPAPSTLVPRLALGLILGLLLGVAAAVTLETFRPRIAGIRALARLLSAPVLGNARQRPAAVANAMTLGARRHGVETVVVLGVDQADDEVVQQMLTELRTPTRAEARAQARVAVPDSRRPKGAGRDQKVAEEDQTEDVAEGGPGIPSGVHFTDITQVTPAQEPTAGVVVVSSGSPRQRDVEVLEDVLTAMRWPVIGIVEARAHHSGQS